MPRRDAHSTTYFPRLLAVALAALACAASARGQSSSSAVEIVTVYSQNGKFYLKSVPFDDDFPTTRGKTYVYEAGRPEPLYVFGRGFDSVDEHSNNLILGDDGETVFYAIPSGADEEKEALKSVNVYRHGLLLRSYTETEVNGCDKERERCSLLYSNFAEVVDAEKSRLGSEGYEKTFKEGVGEREKFLSDFPIFADGREVYLTDSKKRVHVFDLGDGSLVRSGAFDDLYEQLKGRARFTRTELRRFESPEQLYDFPKLKDGRAAADALAAYIGMKPVSASERGDEQYKSYTLKMTAYVLGDGGVEIEELEADPALPEGKILEFFAVSRFDAGALPEGVEKWSVTEEYFQFRNRDARVARRERAEERGRERAERRRRLTAETIEGVYIPKDLGECFAELDKLLREVDREEMRALPEPKEMIQYHMGLGMHLRNRWGLWGGSRLQKYFTDRGVEHPDHMSGVVLYFYHDWLNGRTETWKRWEKNPKGKY
ncbi:MAG TPA: DUF6794 domain-containing protein [Pyrinomonadaceae bacterium]|jgi:hypothetical protein|nr:DUF6794 domain-containing protein [Pyrinomonadaceae bacterium]